MATSPMPIFSVEQYLEMEDKAEFKSEYIQGHIVAMSGARLNHNSICMTLSAALVPQLMGSSCRASGGDVKIRIAEHDVYTYPDLVVYCGNPKFDGQRRDTITDATVIVEVLFPSTQSYDRGDKFRYYRALSSFSEYLLIAQDRIRVEHYSRQADGAWRFCEYSDPTAVIELISIGCKVALSDLYAWVTFEE